MPSKSPDFSPLTSFRRRPESSGLDKPFPPSGNDNHRNYNRTCRPTNPAIPSPSRPPFLDSSLRWNDDGGGNGFVAIPTASLPFSKKSQPQPLPLPSFRRRPESSGFNKPFPRRGNDNHRNDNRTRHPPKPAIPSPSRPPFLDSSLRWNDNGGRNRCAAILTAPLPCLANYLTSAPPSFRRRPESSGLYKPFPHSGNDNTQTR